MNLKNYFTVCIAAVLLVLPVAFMLSSCTPTFPKDKLPELIKKVFHDEYGMDVEVTLEGSTLGIYHPMEGLLDVGLGIGKEAWDNIGNLISVASRVALSTDADIRFYCVITQDARLPEMQVVIIKYVEDIKRSMYRNIGRDESYKRMLFSINLTPQARKERTVEQVFDKLGLEEQTRENVLSEFFRSPPTKLSDMGFWRGQFYIKDISFEEFIAAQISNRIKLDFRSQPELADMFQYTSSEGQFFDINGEKALLLKYKIFDHAEKGSMYDLQKRKVEEIIKIVNEVVYGYKFKDFDYLELEDQLLNERFWVTSNDIFDFAQKKLAMGDILKTSSAEIFAQ